MSFVFDSISTGINAISKAVNTVCEIAGAIGKAVSSFAHSIKPVLGPVLLTIANTIPHPAVKLVATCANALLHTLALFHPNETVENMGDRALHAAEQGITTDKFENFDDYMNALRNFELNPDLKEKFGPAEKLVAGLGIATLGIEDKFKFEAGSLNDLWLLPLTNSEYFTPERIDSLLAHGKTIGDVSAYLEKRMNADEAREFKSQYEFTSEGKPMNDSELGKLYDAFDNARTEWAKLEQQVKTQD
jgi:hypothetical protein